MKSRFVRLGRTADADDPEPGPTPIPIRIVTDASTASVASDPPNPATQGERNDAFYPAWDRFLAVEPKRAKNTSSVAQQIEDQRIEIEQSPGDGLQNEATAGRSWEQAAGECREKVAAIVEECQRLNQKYRDAVFDLEANPDCLKSLTGCYPRAIDQIDVPPWIKRVEDIFDNPQFFIDGATAMDVHQGASGDCWFLASLMAVSAKKELIDKLCVARDEKVGVYGFVFYRDGEWIHEVIDDKLFLRVGDDDDLDVVRDWDVDKKERRSVQHVDLDKLREALQKGSAALYFGHCTSDSSETWLPLIEKAYSKAHGDYYAIEGGFTSEGIEDLTGGVAVTLNPEDILDKDRFWREQLSQVNKKFLFGGSSTTAGAKGIVGAHAYTVLDYYEDENLRLLKLRNPWGEREWEGDWSDGSNLWTPDMMIKLNHTFGDDGVYWMAYPDFLKHFHSINRVRLFDDTWKVGQAWTSVSVPWIVHYLDTHFQFQLKERGPVVIVLAQPDDRYFYGLRGRYLFSMHFRIYKDGEEGKRWIVRSLHNSGGASVFTRSVSAEIEDLAPGTYNVIFKVTAVRSTTVMTAEEAILEYAKSGKQKLLDVGRRFDYAQSKGNLRGLEKAVRVRKRQESKDRRKTRWRRKRRVNQREREWARQRRKRVNEAMREKRRELELKQREKAKAREERREAKKNLSSTEPQPDASKTANQEQGDAGMADSDTAKPATSEVIPAVQATSVDVCAGAEAEQTPKVQTSEGLTAQLSTLELEKTAVENHPTPVTPSASATPADENDNDGDSDGEYESAIDPPSELEDDDFDWNSDLDAPVESSSDDEEGSSSKRGIRPKSLFDDDPWNALCVLGLRVYAKSADLEVRVVKPEDGP